MMSPQRIPPARQTEKTFLPVVLAALASVVALRPAFATTYLWSSPVDGTWSDTTRWTPAGSPNNAADDVVIGGGATPFTVSLTSATTFDTLTLNGTGSLQLYGGTINGGTITSTTTASLALVDAASTPSGYLNSVTLDAPISVGAYPGAWVAITNSLTIARPVLDIPRGIRLEFKSSAQLLGNATLNFVGNSSMTHTTQVDAPVIGAGITIASTGNIANSTALTAFQNNGTITVNNPNAVVYLGYTPTTVQHSTWSSAGTINLSQGRLYLGGSNTTAGLGTFNRSGGSLYLIGTLNNANATLNLDSLGSMILSGGTIYGGAVTSTTAAQLFTESGSFGATTFDALSLSADLRLGPATTVYSKNGLVLNGTISLTGASNSGNPTVLDITGEDVTGSGSIVFDNNANNRLNVQPSPVLVSLGPGIVVRTGTGGGSISHVYNNYGTISAQTSGQTIAIGIDHNYGTIAATNGGILSLGGVNNHNLISVASNSTIILLSPITNNGTFQIDGGRVFLFDFAPPTGTILRNAGNVIYAKTYFTPDAAFDLGATPWGRIDLGNGAAFSNITLSSSAGAPQILNTTATTSIATFTNISLATDITLAGSTSLIGKTALALGNVTVRVGDPTGGATLDLSNANLSGSGIISFEGASPSVAIIKELPQGATMRTSQGSAAVTLTTNSGTVSAESAGNSITLTDLLANKGALQAKDGGLLKLVFNGGSFANTGTISATNGGTLEIAGIGPTIGVANWGALTASNSTLRLDYYYLRPSQVPFNSNTTYLLPNGVLLGPSIAIDGPTTSLHVAGGVIYNGINTVSLTATNGAKVIVEGQTLSTLEDIVLNNTDISLQSANLRIYNNAMGATTPMGGNGSLIFDGADSTNKIAYSKIGKISGGITIRTGAAGGLITHTSTLTLEGKISAQSAGLDIAVTVPTFSSTGVIEALSGGTVHLNNSTSFSNAGMMRVGANATILPSRMTSTAAARTVVDIDSSTSFGKITVAGTAAVNGALTISLPDSFSAQVGQAFTFLTAGTSRTGAFNALAVVGASPAAADYTFTVSYPSKAVTATLTSVDPNYLSVNGSMDLAGTAISAPRLAGSGTITNSSTLPGILAINGTSRFDGRIMDGAATIALIKNVGGALTLGGDNAYAGGTTINAGMIVADNSTGSATGTGPVTLNAGALGGHGFITGAVTAGSSPHTIAPSAANPATTGTLTLGKLTTNANTTLAFNLLGPGDSDSLTITNTNGLTLNGGAIEFDPAAPLGYHNIIQYTGAIQGPGLASLTLPATANNITCSLDTTTNGTENFITLHKGFLGDANDDGLVNFSDFVLLSNNFGQFADNWSDADFNHDHLTNFSDFVILSNQFGQSLSGSNFTATPDQLAALQAFAATAIPEPATLPLLAFAATALLTRRRLHAK